MKDQELWFSFVFSYEVLALFQHDIAHRFKYTAFKMIYEQNNCQRLKTLQSRPNMDTHRGLHDCGDVMDRGHLDNQFTAF